MYQVVYYSNFIFLINVIKENDENDVQMKRLKTQIEEAKLPEQSFESTYITKKVKR